MKSSLSVAILAALSLPASPTIAETQTNTMETMVVTANRSEQLGFSVLAATESFQRSDIEAMQIRSMSDLLARVAGISISQQGTKGHKSSLFVRGGNSDHVLVLVDGVRVGSATLGSKDVSAINPDLVEKVEVIRGPRAALWGSDAIGGVIQIFTRRHEAGQGQTSLALGSDGYRQGQASLGMDVAGFSTTVALSAEESDGFDVIQPDPNNPFAVDQPDDDGYDRQGLTVNAERHLSKHFHLDLIGQLEQGTTEIDSSFGGDEQDYDNQLFLARGTLDLGWGQWQTSLSHSSDDSRDNADEIDPSMTVSKFITERDQLSSTLSFNTSDKGEYLAGFDYYEESVESHQAFSETERDASAVFAVARQQLDNLRLEGSLRHDSVGDTDSETTYQLAVGYQLSPSTLLSVSHGTAFKAPSFNDLYWPASFGSSGNPDLKSETAANSELLLRHQGEHWQAEMSYYRTDFDNLIEWAPVDANDPMAGFQPFNVAKAEIEGGELTLTGQWQDSDHRLTLSHVDARNEATGQQLVRRPHFTAFYQFNYDLGDLQLVAELNHQGARRDSNGQQLSDYTLANLGVTYRWSSHWRVRARVENLTDKEYFQVSEYPGADRQARVSVQYQW